MEGEEDELISHHPLSSPPALEIDSESQVNLGLQDLPTSAAAAEVEVEPSDAINSSSSKLGPLPDDLRDKIVRQVEYYLSDENLPTDKFLLNFVKKDKEGFVPIAVITSFKKMKKLVQQDSLVEAALRTSSQLVVSADGKKVKRLHPLPDTHSEDAKLRTVLVENLPEDYSTESIQRIFGDVGNIKNIRIRDPHSSEESRKASKAEKLISRKLHALVEYETVEAAERAVATLNNEMDWRSMRVQFILKRVVKHGSAPKVRKGTEKSHQAEKSHHAPALDTAGDEKDKSFVHDDETLEDEQEEEHIPSDKVGRRGRNRGRGRSHKHYNVNVHGHGSAIGSVVEGPSKPPPGPRMPDGTRGFAMGRGKHPPPSDHQCQG